MALVGPRLKLQQLMKATLADEAARNDWVYRPVRPAWVPATWEAGQHVSGDCSKGVQYLCRWAGAPDPMGNGFGPYGNSQTLCFHLRHVPEASLLKVGDIVTFGHDGDDHAAMVLEPGSDPLLWSFGHPGAPNTYRLSWDHREHQLLILMHDDPAPPPTPQALLRAHTGWFSWVAWRLGEGAWVHYGKLNPNVRPSVPKVIPATWWTRYTRYLLARKKGNKATAPVRPPS